MYIVFIFIIGVFAWVGWNLGKENGYRLGKYDGYEKGFKDYEEYFKKNIVDIDKEIEEILEFEEDYTEDFSGYENIENEISALWKKSSLFIGFLSNILELKDTGPVAEGEGEHLLLLCDTLAHYLSFGKKDYPKEVYQKELRTLTKIITLLNGAMKNFIILKPKLSEKKANKFIL